MSALLDIVRDLTAVRRDAEREWSTAIVRARAHHSLSEIARAADITKSAVAYILKREKGVEK